MKTGWDGRKVAIIGMGGAGSAALYHVQKEGGDAVGYEQFLIGHRQGSSHGQSRIIRYTYPDPLYTSLMADAYPLWEALEHDSQREPGALFARTGGLYFGPEDHPEMQAVAENLREVGLPHETLTPDECARRHPALRLFPGEVAHFQPESGFLRASDCVLAHLQLARSQGAELHEKSEIVHIEQHPEHQGGGVELRTRDGYADTYDRVIVTAGPWMGKLFASLNLPLFVTRQQITYLPVVGDDASFAPDRLPVWIDAQTHWYGFPADGCVEGVKLAPHVPGTPFDPDMTTRTPDPDEDTTAAEYAKHRFPDLGPVPMHSQVCLYTNTPDEDFIVDSPPGMPDVLLVSGCSGHGFKFTALLGKIAADWARGRDYGRDLFRFRLSRFAATMLGKG